MSTSLPSLYAEAWREPRKSMRMMLDLKLAERDRLLMLAVHFVMTAASVILMVYSYPEGPMAEVLAVVPAVPRYVVVALATYIGYRISSFLLRVIGRAFGGHATDEDCRTVNAWWMMITSVVTLAEALLSLVIPLQILSILNFLVTIASIAIFSAYAAEVHGFKSVPRVAGVTVAAMLGVLILMNFLVLALVPQ